MGKEEIIGMIMNASNAQLAAIEKILISGTTQDRSPRNNRQTENESNGQYNVRTMTMGM